MSLIIQTPTAIIGTPSFGDAFDSRRAPQGSPEWWLGRLHAELSARAPRIRKYEDYYDGKHPLKFATGKFREVFGHLFGGFADNWCDLVVDACVERLGVEGFRFGKEGLEGDSESWRIWQANGLDADSDIAHTEAVKCGEAYLLIDEGEDPATPLVTVEHPLQVIVAYQPGKRLERAAAIKEWVADDGRIWANVYLPEAVYKFRTLQKPQPGTQTWKWVEREAPVANPLGVVPIIALRNNPGLLCGGRSDLEHVIPLQDAINKECNDLIIASEFAAYRQRWATGMDDAPTDATGTPTSDLKAGVSRLWSVEDPDVKFGEFGASDLNNYVQAIEMLVQHVAAQTRTPPHYLLGSSGVFPSGESLKATETGLVAKVRRRSKFFGEGWEEGMRLAHKLAGNPELASAADAETIWKDPESRTEGERVDALVKMRTLGVPIEVLWQKWGASPQEIEQWSQMKLAEEARAQLAGAFGPLDQGVPPQGSPKPPAGGPAPAPTPGYS